MLICNKSSCTIWHRAHVAWRTLITDVFIEPAYYWLSCYEILYAIIRILIETCIDIVVLIHVSYDSMGVTREEVVRGCAIGATFSETEVQDAQDVFWGPVSGYPL